MPLLDIHHNVHTYFSAKHNRHAAYVFFKRVLKPSPAEWKAKTLNIDKHVAYAYAIASLIKKDKFYVDVKQRQIKYLNNRIDWDHG